ncbi:MAG: hypothetical protein ACRCXM_10595 [Beijerinckiaceae bacterium]
MMVLATAVQGCAAVVVTSAVTTAAVGVGTVAVGAGTVAVKTTGAVIGAGVKAATSSDDKK